MAIDFLIFALLLFSFIVNLLALGAFWITPGLRTTANRFTINLLVVNLVGCCILAPTLFLSSPYAAGAGDLLTATSDDSIEIYAKAGNHQMTIRHNGKLVEQEGIILQQNASSQNQQVESDLRTVETTIFKRNSTYYQELTIDENSDGIVITEIEADRPQAAAEQPEFVPEKTEEDLLLAPFAAHAPLSSMRCWSIDMAAALGALAVLLVVGDTWCAVTDPLRYHTRISGLKTWLFITLIWALGILFGALSVLRDFDFTTETLLERKHNYLASYTSTDYNVSSAQSIFGMVFASLYFVVIILLPFGFVCGMYWRIFSEARENGLRMRQNGSSPLLQSALNLTHQQQAGALTYTNSLNQHRHSISSASSQGGVSGGLQMQIDHQPQRKSSPACLRRDSTVKVLLPTISDDGASEEANTECNIDSELIVEQPHSAAADRNQNILFTLQAASGEIKRNYSVRQLPLLGTSSQDLIECDRLRGIRQVHSSPNLQRHTLHSSALPEEETQLEQQQQQPQRLQPHTQMHHLIHPPQKHKQYSSLPAPLQQQHSQHALQIPCIQASPKALSYMSSLRHRLSNASSLFKYREESRAARISILVVIMFLVSYLPYGFLVLLQSRLHFANSPHSTQIAIFMVLLANLSSPVIFAYRNKRVRRGVKRLFGLEKRSRERVLQRQASSLKFSSNLNIKRNGSKVSNFSTNSYKYLTPQSSLVSNGGTGGGKTAIVLALRPNNSCSTIINFGLQGKSEGSVELADEDNVVAAVNNNVLAVSETKPKKPVRPVLQRGITIVEQIPLSGKFASKPNLFQMFFQGSKNLNCAVAASQASQTFGLHGKQIKPAEV